MTGDDWSHPEIVRNLKALTEAVRDLAADVKSLHDRFVPREEHNLRASHVDERLHSLALRVVDVEADLERHRREHAQAWSSWVTPIATGVLVAVVAALLGLTLTR